MESATTFRVLGPLQVIRGSAPVTLSAIKQQILLAVLISHANEPVSSDLLVEALWSPDAPPSAAANIRAYVYHLRRILGDHNRIANSTSGYSLIADSAEIDAHLFEELAEQGRRLLNSGDADRAGDVLRHALALWRGPALGEIADVPYLRSYAAGLDELRLIATEWRIQADLQTGRHDDLIPEISRLVGMYPMRERFRAQLMLALYRCGRQVEALDAYREARRWLVEEHGLEPGSELRELERAILKGEAELDSKIDLKNAGNLAPLAMRGAVPYTLPTDAADFTGRQGELWRLREEMTGRRGTTPAISIITGTAGVGKSALAVHFAHSMRGTFTDGIIYMALHGAARHPTSVAVALERFLRILGVDGSVIPETVEERAEMFRARLAGNNVLIVLDDAADEAQVELLLPGSPECGVLITSRARLTGIPGTTIMDLDVLPSPSAVELLARVSGHGRVTVDPEAAAELVRLCGHLPLAVRIAGARLADRPHWPISRMLSRLTDERRRLDELVHGHLDVRASLELSYRGLSPRSRRLFALLALFDAPDFAPWVSAALLDTSIRAAEEIMDSLVDARLLEVSGHDGTRQPRYRFHDLVLFYARECEPNAESTRGPVDALVRVFGAFLALVERAHRRLAGGDYMVIHGTARRWAPDDDYVEQLLEDPLEWIEVEQFGIVAAVRQAARLGMDELCWDLAVTSAAVFEIRSHYESWSRTHQDALAAVRIAGNDRGKAAVLAELGEMSMEKHQYSDAAAMLERALKLFTATGEEHGRAIVLQRLATVYRLRGDAQDGLGCCTEALQIFHSVGDYGSAVLAIREMAQIYLERGSLKDAMPLLEEALTMAEKAGSRRLHSQVMYRLGELYLDQGELEKAESALATVLSFVCDIGDRKGEAWSLLGLGRTRMAQRRYSQAADLLRYTMSIAGEIGERVIEIRSLIALGELERQRHHYREAATVLDRAARIAEHIGAEVWRERVARALDQLPAHFHLVY